MRSKLILFIPLLFVITFLGCEQADKAENSPNQADLKSFIDSVELPYNFSIAFDPAEVQTVDSAKIYSTAFLEFDHEVVVDTLLAGNVTATENYAEGIQYQADSGKQTEYLWVFDGGKSIGIESGVNGGLSYGVHLDDDFLFSKQFTVIENTPGPPDNITQEYGYDLKSNYDSFTDLDFLPYEKALAEVEAILTTVGFPALEVAETYSLDLETMTHHYDLYLESQGNRDTDRFNWSKEDEAYLFFFRQIVDGIPLTNIQWKDSYLSQNDLTATSLAVFYAEDNQIDIRAENFLVVSESISEESLIPPTNALAKLINNYSEVLLSHEKKLLSMELSYVASYKSNQEYQLVPAWVFELAKKVDWNDDREKDSIYINDYKYFVVNAVTGEQITGMNE